MNFFKFQIIVLFCLFQLSMPVYAINIKYLKDTHTILPDVNYAPFQGLIFIEADIAEQWCMFHTMYQAKKIQEELKVLRSNNLMTEAGESIAKAAIDFLKAQKSSATEDLIQQMFHIAGEAFNVTEALDNPIRQLTVKQIGVICKIIFDSNSQTVLQQDKDYQKAMLAHIKTRKKVTPEDEQSSIVQLWELYAKFFTPKDVNLVLQNYLKDKLSSYLAGLQFKKSSGSLFSRKDFYPFVHALVNSLQECDAKNPLSCFPANTTQGLLLGYMLAKSDDRQDLQDYFRGFLNDDSFVLPDALYTHEELTALVSKSPDWGDGKSFELTDEHLTDLELLNVIDVKSELKNMEEFANYLCAVIYVEKYTSKMPKLVSNRSVLYKKNSFPDCMETVMRNLTNIITYNPKQQRFELIPAHLSVSVPLQNFYTDPLNASSVAVKNSKVHQSWVSLMENQLGCSYNRLLVSGTQDFIEVRSLCDGVIPMTNINMKLPKKEVEIAKVKYTVFEQKIGSKTYWLVPAGGNLDCFELMPTLSNVILLLSNMFNLKLPSAAQGLINKIKKHDFAHEALEKDFDAKYFEKMCKQLGWKVDAESIAYIKMLQDQPDHSIQISIELPSKEVFELSLTDKAHGSINLSDEDAFKHEIPIKYFWAASSGVKAAMLAAQLVNYQNIPKLYFSTLCSTGLDRFIPVINKDNRIELMSDLFEFDASEQYLTLLLVSFNMEYDIHYQNQICDLFLGKIDKGLSAGLLKTLNILADAFYAITKFVNGKILYSVFLKDTDAIWQWIETGMKDEESYAREYVVIFLDELVLKDVLKGSGVDKIDLMLKWIDADIRNPEVSESYQVLLCNLIDRGFLSPEQIAHVKELSKTIDSEILESSLRSYDMDEKA